MVFCPCLRRDAAGRGFFVSVTLRRDNRRLVSQLIGGFSIMAISIDINNQILENQMHALQACMTVDSDINKRLRELIFQELKRVRNDIAGGLKFANGDPRGTRGAVKRYVASKYLGGVVSILDGKASGSKNSYEAPRKLRPGQRGGNRMLRSQRTDDILHYGPDERSFILRFVNSGTAPRYAAGRNVSGKGNRRAFFKMQEEGDYYRGSIAPRNFMSRLGSPSMQRALENLSKMVDEEFDKLFKS